MPEKKTAAAKKPAAKTAKPAAKSAKVTKIPVKVVKKAPAKPAAKKAAPKKVAAPAKPVAKAETPKPAAKVEAPKPVAKPVTPKPEPKAVAPNPAPPKPAAPKAPKPPKSSKPARKPEDRLHGKRYRAAAELVEADKQYGLAEAVELAKKTSTTKFDGTVEIHVRLGIDAREAEQSIRGTVQLPAGTGKTLKVLAFVPAAKHAAAKTAGADFVADEPTLKKLQEGWTGFDVAVATPDQMVTVGKLGKVLGPKGLMPSPKAGTVNEKFEEAISAVKKGSIEFRVAKDGTLHAGIGKASFTAEDLNKNAAAYINAVKAAKPTDAKGTYIKSITLAATMGPGIKVAVNESGATA